MASAWLIKHFVDFKARFYFEAEIETVENGVRFDMFGAEFTHVGEDCTFKTLVKRFGLVSDAALCEIAEIVHDIDLKDDKLNRLEAVGLNTTVRGLSLLPVMIESCSVTIPQYSAVYTKNLIGQYKEKRSDIENGKLRTEGNGN